MKMDEIRKMSKAQRESKLKELRMEMIKSKATSAKTGSAKTKQIKKIVARILTLNKSQEEELKK